MSFSDAQINNLIYSSCLSLDGKDYDSYLKLFSEEMNYRVVAYSPELRREMVWLDHNFTEMKNLFKMLPQHVKLPGTFFRHSVVYQIERIEQTLKATTSLMLMYTDLNGSTKLMAAGRYHDTLSESDGALLIKSREVRLETRDLGPGIQVPI